MALEYHFFSDGIQDKQQFYMLYQTFLNTFQLMEDQAHFTCFAEDPSDDPDDWRSLIEDVLASEPLGFTPRVKVTLYPHKPQFAREGYDNLLRLIGFLLKSTPSNAAFYLQLHTLKLLRKQGKITLFDVEQSWSPESLATLNEGMAIAEAV